MHCDVMHGFFGHMRSLDFRVRRDRGFDASMDLMRARVGGCAD